jgi:hypothetical protein
MTPGTLMLNSWREPPAECRPLGPLAKVTKLIDGGRPHIMPPLKPRDLLGGTPGGGLGCFSGKGDSAKWRLLWAGHDARGFAVAGGVNGQLAGGGNARTVMDSAGGP